MEDFTKPSRVDIECEKGDSQKVFDASEIRLLLSNGGVKLKAMILIAIKAGLGNTDIAALTPDRFDVNTGWMVSR